MSICLMFGWVRSGLYSCLPTYMVFLCGNGPIFVLSICVFFNKSQSKEVQSFEDQDNPQRQEKNDH